MLARAYNQASAPPTARRSPRASRPISRARTTSPRCSASCRKSEDLLAGDDAPSAAPVVRTINAILLEALRERASDVHFERSRAARRCASASTACCASVEPPRALACGAGVAAEDHGEPRHRGEALPQDGRITLKLGDKPVDVRVSTVPTGHSERVVCACSTRIRRGSIWAF
jgi:general secretion pathway protein E